MRADRRAAPAPAHVIGHRSCAGRLPAAPTLSAIFFVMFPEDQLWRRLIFEPLPARLSFLDSLWTVVMTDLGVRFAGALLEGALLLVSLSLFGEQRFRRQAHLLSLAVLTYRSLLPVPVWTIFFKQVRSAHCRAARVTRCDTGTHAGYRPRGSHIVVHIHEGTQQRAAMAAAARLSRHLGQN
jgi:hypothetical protein